MNNLFTVYKNAIYDEYSVRVGHDKNRSRTERVAKSIIRLGISFEDYISIAIELYADWAEKQGHPYPYFNMITGKMAFERVSELMERGLLVGDKDYSYGDFEEELWYVANYLEHAVNGNGCRPPKRQHDSGIDTRRDVAEYICHTRGIPFVTDDLDYIARKWVILCQTS